MALNAELPEELITIILSKLPVKSLLRFKCVRKSWYSLIKSPNFIHLHLNNSSNHKCILVRRCSEEKHVLSFHSHETLADLGIQFDTPFPTSVIEIVTVSGPCNGLICISSHYDKMFICNPATREFRSLFVPPSFGYRSGYYIETVAFGIDPNSCEYKLVMIGVNYFHGDQFPTDDDYRYHLSPPRYDGDREVVVYDFTTDSWRETGIFFPEPFDCSRKSVTFNGAFHWWPIELGNFSILSFLITDEVIESIPLPEFYSWEHEIRLRDLFVFNKSLALVVYDQFECFEISVMTEYGVKNSWAKLVKLGPMPFAYHPIAFWNSNDEDMLLLEGVTDVETCNDDNHLISCNLQHQNVKHFPIYGFTPSTNASFEVFLYSESLVSVNSIGKSA